MITTDKSRMYAALRCIEEELAKRKPSITRMRQIMLEAQRDIGSENATVDDADPLDEDEASE